MLRHGSAHVVSLSIPKAGANSGSAEGGGASGSGSGRAKSCGRAAFAGFAGGRDIFGMTISHRASPPGSDESAGGVITGPGACGTSAVEASAASLTICAASVM